MNQDVAKAMAAAARYAQPPGPAAGSRPLPWRWVALLLLGLVGLAAAWWLTRPLSPEQQVRRQFTRLATLVSKGGTEGNATMIAKGGGLEGLFADPTEIQTTNPVFGGDSFEAAALASTIINLRQQFTALHVSFADLQVTVTSATDAQATTVVSVRGDGKSGDRFDETRPLAVRLRRVDDKWRFCRFEERPLLER